MSCSRSLGLGAALVLLLGLVGLVPAPAHAAQPQTITFETTPPADPDWFTAEGGLGFAYIARATASSGLEVSYSIAAASGGICDISSVGVFGPGEATVRALKPGTCTILADQPGDAEHLPAPQASQSFEVTRAHTWITKVGQTKALLGKSTFRATLLRPQHESSMSWSQVAFAGQPVTFSVAGKDVCTGTTNAQGVATCKVKLKPADAVRLRFIARYPGNDLYRPVSRTATFGMG